MKCFLSCAAKLAWLILVFIWPLTHVSANTDAAANLVVPININAAAPSTLAHGLKGIGPSKADAIVRYRETHGAFASVDDLVKVKGIGEKTLQKIRGLIVAGEWQPPAEGKSMVEVEAAARAAVQSVLQRSREISSRVAAESAVQVH